MKPRTQENASFACFGRTGLKPLAVQTQRGMSIIELTIALVLSVLLANAAFYILSGSVQSWALQRGMNQINDTSRFTMEMLARELRKAGYRDNVLTTLNDVYPADPTNGFAQGQFIRGNAQTLLLRYQGSGSPADGRIMDCLGNNVAANQTVVIQLTLNQQQLICTRLAPGNPTQEVLGTDLQALRFDYGIETNGDGFADAYQANSLGNNNAVSVKTTLTIVDNQAMHQGTGNALERLNRQFSRVVALRNTNS